LTGMPSPEETLDELYEDVNEQIQETRERRRELKRNGLQSLGKRRGLEFDPNNIEVDSTAENDNILNNTPLF